MKNIKFNKVKFLKKNKKNKGKYFLTLKKSLRMLRIFFFLYSDYLQRTYKKYFNYLDFILCPQNYNSLFVEMMFSSKYTFFELKVVFEKLYILLFRNIIFRIKRSLCKFCLRLLKKKNYLFLKKKFRYKLIFSALRKIFFAFILFVSMWSLFKIDLPFICTQVQRLLIRIWVFIFFCRNFLKFVNKFKGIFISTKKQMHLVLLRERKFVLQLLFLKLYLFFNCLYNWFLSKIFFFTIYEKKVLSNFFFIFFKFKFLFILLVFFLKNFFNFFFECMYIYTLMFKNTNYFLSLSFFLFWQELFLVRTIFRDKNSLDFNQQYINLFLNEQELVFNKRFILLKNLDSFFFKKLTVFSKMVDYKITENMSFSCKIIVYATNLMQDFMENFHSFNWLIVSSLIFPISLQVTFLLFKDVLCLLMKNYMIFFESAVSFKLVPKLFWGINKQNYLRFFLLNKNLNNLNYFWAKKNNFFSKFIYYFYLTKYWNHTAIWFSKDFQLKYTHIIESLQYIPKNTRQQWLTSLISEYGFSRRNFCESTLNYKFFFINLKNYYSSFALKKNFVF